ncbi:hypothetical protein [Labedella endophytica]|uniref:Uncharacterized protein n=1 Tax=Labedella endophytica TaxID=1523160 RepID=A0A433JNQ0_9MICO|nr:hypothetical protein [Labedella endophytica]RUQ97570.1 hypothetical protein ELQ94_15510 [Labedella endophytica]
MDAPDLVAIADALFAGPFGDFTASRNARASEAKKAGNGDLAAAVRALPKPTAAAWILGRIVRNRPGVIDDLADVRHRIEAATAAGERDELRAASHDRQMLVVRLVEEARAAAADAGRPLSASVADEVSDGLLAALGDSPIADALASGRLVSVPRTGGMTPPEIRALVAIPPDGLAPEDADDPDFDVTGHEAADPAEAGADTRSRPRRVPSPAARAAAPSRTPGPAASDRRRLQRELAVAEKSVEAARTDRARRESDRDTLVERRAVAQAELEARREAVRAAQADLDAADEALAAMTADLRSRELEWKRAEATMKRARAAVEDDPTDPRA